MGRPSIGPFLFFDHFGPVTVTPESQHDVRPHPHIGLATVTRPVLGRHHAPRQSGLGAANRARRHQLDDGFTKASCTRASPPSAGADKAGEPRHSAVGGVPVEAEEAEPSFVHTPADAIPQLQVGTPRCVLIGQAWGQQSPVVSLAPLCTWISSCLPVGRLRCLRPWHKRWACTPWMLLSP